MSLYVAGHEIGRFDTFQPMLELGRNIEAIDPTEVYDWESVFGLLNSEGLIEQDKPVPLYNFLSETNSEFDQSTLDNPDLNALEAAIKSGGLLCYQALRGGSFCAWRLREDAKAATESEEHIEAARLANRAYGRHRLVGMMATLGSSGKMSYEIFADRTSEALAA